MLDLSTLNAAQQEAVTAKDQSLLVIAGAGSGKTRTLVYRLAWLIEQGISINNLLLLTFTRKAASQMLDRASVLIEQNMRKIRSGTFHAFAFSVLRQYPEFCLRHSEKRSGQVTVMDSADQNACIAQCKDEKKIGKGDRSFPKAPAIISLLSKARNKEMPIESLLHREAQHLLPYGESLEKLNSAYIEYKRKHGLLDYDDLLFELETLFMENPEVQERFHNYITHIMVDEYQDTNKVQARLVRLLAGAQGNVMAVGDDAQSIYAFRGATVKNILDFPKLFDNTKIIYLEENYRSLQPILDVANQVLVQATEGYNKHLYSRRAVPPLNSNCVRVYKPLSDVSQAKLASQRIQDLLLQSQPSEIAVLFRSSYQAYHLEVELNKRGIEYRKFGGIKYTEASHVKDLLAYVRLIINPQDMPAFERIASFSKGVGAKTAQKIYSLSQAGDTEKFQKEIGKLPELQQDIELINLLRINQYNDPQTKLNPSQVLNRILEQYRPKMDFLYPEDYPRRLQGLEELLTIAIEYYALDLFIADLVLDMSEEDNTETQKITLSTVHSAKGLEWDSVLIMDLVEERFPSRHAIARPEDFEEERRLLYVACTRARNTLDLFMPMALYQRSSGGYESVLPTPFLRNLSRDSYSEYQEIVGGGIFQKNYNSPEYVNTSISSFMVEENIPIIQEKPKTFGYCTHKVFGKGKIIEEVENDKYKINFIGIGVKTILKGYVELIK